MGDQDQRQPACAHQSPKDFNDLRLHRHIQRGSRLVRDDQVGIARQRHGNHDALFHAARQLMRIGGTNRPGLGDAQLRQNLDGAGAGGGAGQAQM